MLNFSYDDGELPTIDKRSSSEVDKNKHGVESVNYYDVGSWSMSDLPSEDGDIEHARSSALAWIAWYQFLLNERSNKED